jgi:hypothetical protein
MLALEWKKERSRSGGKTPSKHRSPKKRSINVKDEKAFVQQEKRRANSGVLPDTDIRVTKRQIIMESYLVDVKQGQILIVNSSLATAKPVGFQVSKLEAWGAWFTRVTLCKTFASLKVYEALVNTDLVIELERARLEEYELKPGEAYTLKKKEVFVCAMGDVTLTCESKKDASYFALGDWYGLTVTMPKDSKGRGRVCTAVLDAHKDITVKN